MAMNRPQMQLRKLVSTKNSTASGQLKGRGWAQRGGVGRATPKKQMLPLIVQRRNFSCDLIHNEAACQDQISSTKKKTSYQHYRSKAQWMEETQARLQKLRSFHNRHQLRLSGLQPVSESFSQNCTPSIPHCHTQVKTHPQHFLNLIQTKALMTDHGRREESKGLQLPKMHVCLGLAHKRSASVAKVRQSSKLEWRELMDLLHIQAAQRDPKLAPISRKQFVREILGSVPKGPSQLSIETPDRNQANSKLIQVDLDFDPNPDIDLDLENENENDNENDIDNDNERKA
jgi:hypothetical protein